MTINLIFFGLISFLILIYQLSGKSKDKPIFTDWLMPGGSNSHTTLYSIEKVQVTTVECVFPDKNKKKKIDDGDDTQEDENEDGKSEAKFTLFVHIFVHLKALTIIAVVIAILAVDFPSIFYRSLCKSEELGISLMDTGVALITLNAGISGMKARPWNSDVNSIRHFVGDVIKSSRGILFPIIVGSLRFWILDDFDY